MSSSLAHPRALPSRRDVLRVWFAVPLSLAGHAAAVALVVALSTLTAAPPKPKKPPSRPVSLRAIDSRRWAQNRGTSAPVIERETPVPLHPKGQVVDVAAGNNQVAPDAKYLAETNNRVKQETVAREQTSKYSRAAPKNAPNPMAMPAARGRAAPSLLGASASELFASDLGFRPRLSNFFQKPVQGNDETAPAQPGAVGSQTADEPSRPGSDSSEGGGAPNDDLNVPKGDGTFLNTREWKYAGFFNRVKQAVGAVWDPNRRLRQKGRDVGVNDRITTVHVALRPDGSIYEIYVAQSCGLEELDQEAINAFERAAPFANPPAGLVEDGLIRFGFGFHLQSQTGAGGLQFFRAGH